MGLFSLAGWLKRQGHQVEIVHAGLSPRPFSIVDEISLRGARAVFFPMHWTRQIGPVLEAATQIKTILPGVVVVLGGFTASFFARAILEKFPAVDAVVRGDGELPAERLSEQLEKRRPDFSKVPNLVWRQGERLVENQTTFLSTENFPADSIMPVSNFWKTATSISLACFTPISTPRVKRALGTPIAGPFSTTQERAAPAAALVAVRVGGRGNLPLAVDVIIFFLRKKSWLTFKKPGGTVPAAGGCLSIPSPSAVTIWNCFPDCAR